MGFFVKALKTGYSEAIHTLAIKQNDRYPICSHFFQGFLAKDLQAEALGKLDHRVKIAAEQFMKILEQIDALVIYKCSQFFLCACYVFFLCVKHIKC